MSHLHFLRQSLSLGSAISLALAGHYGALAQPEAEFDPPPSPGRPSGPTIPGGSNSELRAYDPPADLKNPNEDHTGGAVQGCGDEVAAIAPRLNSIGQTASTNPTFVWYNFSDENDPIEFQLYRYEDDGSFALVDIEQYDTSQNGFMAYTLPPEVDELEVGEVYLWQVVLYCDQDFNEPGQFTSAEIEVVELPADLATGLPEDAVDRGRAYAGAGLWYDAFAAVYDAETPEAEALRRDLLLDLADLEVQLEEPVIVDLSEQLRDIADF